MFNVTDLTKTYGGNPVIDHVTFTAPDGLVTGFLGPNGAGKSTTMRCMLGLDRADSGTAHFAGAPLHEHRNPARVVGAMLDAEWMNPGLTARTHLRSIAAGAGIPDSRADECLRQVGLESVAKRRISGFSLGMRQRLGLATALLGDPGNVILDEPANGLDPDGIRWLRGTVRTLAAEGRAVLISSHLLHEMQLIADRLVIIGGGRILGEWDKDDLVSRHGDLETAYWSIAEGHVTYGAGR
ncbi:ATP-binding cassette domain-containing protein [Corynebacterium sp. 335C]